MESRVGQTRKRRPLNGGPLREEPVPKKPNLRAGTVMAAAGGGSVNLVYPFWYSVTPPELNPPFLDPTGPLYEQDGHLAIRLATPLGEMNRSVALNYDNSALEVTNSGNLAVKIDPEGPIDTSEEGLTVRVDGVTLEVDADWELAVRTDPEGPIQSNAAGLTLNVDDTLMVTQDATTQKYELGLNLSTAGPLTADDNGLDLEYDPQSLQLLPAAESSSGPLLAVKLKPGGGIEKGEDGLYAVTSSGGGTTGSGTTITATPPLTLTGGSLALTADPNSLDTANNSLSVKLKQQGGIQASSAGLGVAVDQSLTITDNTLEVQPDPAGPLYISDSGLNVRTDNETVTVTQSASGKQLSVALDPRGCLVSLANVIKLMYKTSLDIDNNFLTVKLKPGGGISSDVDGLYLTNSALSTVNLAEEDATPSGTTVVRLTSGDPRLRTVNSTVLTDQGSKFPCSYFLLQTNAAGLLTTVLTLRLQAEQLAARTDLSKTTSFFTFWVGTGQDDGVPTALQAPTVLPELPAEQYFTPLVQQLGTTSPQSLNPEVFGGQKFSVCGNGFINDTRNPYFEGRATALSLVGEKPAIGFLFQVPAGPSIFDPATQGDIVLGPVTYCCVAANAVS